MIYSQKKFIDNGTTIISNTIFAELFSSENGGAIQITVIEKSLEIYSSSFCNCISGSLGGAVYSSCNKNKCTSNMFSCCRSESAAALFLSQVNDNTHDLLLSYAVLFLCDASQKFSNAGELFGSADIKNLNISNCKSKHIIFLIVGYKNHIQTIQNCQFTNNTASIDPNVIQYNSDSKSKIVNTNFVGLKENNQNIYAIRLTQSNTLSLENCYFIQEFTAIFIRSTGNAVVTINNCYCLNDIPVGLDGYTVECKPDIQIADVNFGISAKCPKSYTSHLKRLLPKIASVLSLVAVCK